MDLKRSIQWSFDLVTTVVWLWHVPVGDCLRVISVMKTKGLKSFNITPSSLSRPTWPVSDLGGDRDQWVTPRGRGGGGGTAWRWLTAAQLQRGIASVATWSWVRHRRFATRLRQTTGLPCNRSALVSPVNDSRYPLDRIVASHREAAHAIYLNLASALFTLEYYGSLVFAARVTISVTPGIPRCIRPLPI